MAIKNKTIDCKKVASDSDGREQFRSIVYWSGEDELRVFYALDKYVYENKRQHDGAFGYSTVIKIAVKEYLSKKGLLK